MRSVALIAVAILALAAVALPIQSAFAATISLKVAPNPAPEDGGGTRVAFSGTEVPAKGGSTIYIGIFGYPGCTGTPFITQSTTELSSGAYALVLTTGDIGGIGYYSVLAFDPSTNALSACQSFTITSGSPPPGYMPIFHDAKAGVELWFFTDTHIFYLSGNPLHMWPGSHVICLGVGARVTGGIVTIFGQCSTYLYFAGKGVLSGGGKLTGPLVVVLAVSGKPPVVMTFIMTPGPLT